jgi:exodeoxyribonuclease VII large subunit
MTAMADPYTYNEPNTDPYARREEIYSVTRLIREARLVLETAFPLLLVEGEVSNLSRPASGHLYFTLKDASGQIRAAMFRNRNQSLRFAPRDGLRVLARARVTLYEARGEFQLIVESMQPAGEGALRIAFEDLKARLAAEGLFSAEKKTLPPHPRRVGVITSPTGAAIRDCLSVLQRRQPGLEVIVYPVPVQGEGAGREIARMIALADARRECDCLLLVRGGGSLEDLWSFNEECVARALHACRLPVVSGVGHEIDFTIADLAADVRAPTPSAAAELISTPDRDTLLGHCQAQGQRLHRAMARRLAGRRDALLGLTRRLRHPGRRLLELAQRLDELTARSTAAMGRRLTLGAARLAVLSAGLQGHRPDLRIAHQQALLVPLAHRLAAAMERRLDRARARLDRAAGTLDIVSPLQTLARGYAIVSRVPGGEICRDGAALVPGMEIRARLARGGVRCRVEDAWADGD